MAIGFSAPSNEDNTGALDKPQTPPFVHIPRPFNSPRLQPRKRQLETESDADSFKLPFACQDLSSSSECPPAKQPKLEIQRNMEILDLVAPETPEMKEARSLGTEMTPPKLPSLRGPKPNLKLEQAVEVAMKLFREVLTEYALEKDLRGEDKADKLAERLAGERYEELKNAIVGLLPWAGEMKASSNGKYDIVAFRGRKTTRNEVNRRQLQHFRAEGAQARAWEALCAVMAAISSREEKVWLEYHEIQDDIDKMLNNKHLCKSKRSARRRAAIREMIPKLVEEGAGAFAPYLIDPKSIHHISFARGLSGHLPATHMTFRRMPLWDALKTMDDDGPLRADAFEKEWCFAAGRQFALQDLQYGHKDGSRKDRTYARKLRPEKKLRNLLRSKAPVVLLDTLAALGPRDVCKNQGFSAIVTEELHCLFRQAKEQGEAVVFSLGSEFPHKLAEKVYLRPPLANYGMRVGCLRWRESSSVPWAREFKWDDRITLGLQMP